MKKLISFSLWGDNPKYCVGAIKNCDLASKIYPDWTCRFYCNKNVPKNIINSLIEKENTEVVIIEQNPDWKFAAARFLAISDYSCEYIIFRDTDSRLNFREKSAVENWIDSGKSLHIMKDHLGHCAFPIFAGMFGIKGRLVPNISELLNLFDCNAHYNYDQFFLQKNIFSKFLNDICLHDEIFNKNPFPTQRVDYEFVGEVFDENDNRNQDHRNSLINFLKINERF